MVSSKRKSNLGFKEKECDLGFFVIWVFLLTAITLLPVMLRFRKYISGTYLIATM